MAHLKVIKGGVEVQNIDLARYEKPELLLGRSPEADVVLDDRAVGREHAILVVNQRGFSIQKKSKFGKMLINGIESAESVLKPGDVIAIADYQVVVEEKSRQTQAKVEQALASENQMFGGSEALVAELPPLAESQTSEINLAERPETRDVVTEPPKEATPPAAESESQTRANAAIATEARLEEQMAQFEGSLQIDRPNAGGPEAVGFDQGTDKTAILSQNKVVAKLAFKAGEANVQEYELSKDEVSVGRASGCDIIIGDKKSSRKHLVLQKVGAVYIAKDQGSANGSYVNGNKITQQELASGDVLRIGSTEFTFQALDQEYFDKQSQFLSTQEVQAAEPADEVVMDGAGPSQAVQGFANAPDPDVVPGGVAGFTARGVPLATLQQNAAAVSGFVGIGTPVNRGKQSLVEKFKQLPMVRKLLIVAAIVAGVGILSFEEEAPKNAQNAKQAVDSVDAAFNALPQEKRQFVINTYDLAVSLYKNQEFERAKHEINRVLEILPGGYKDAKDIKAYAEKSIRILGAKEEEKRRKEAEEKLRSEVDALVKQAEALVEKGKFDEAKQLFSQVLERDPENPTILRLRAQIEEVEQRARAVAESERERSLKRKALLDLLAEGRALVKAGKYYEAIDRMQDAPAVYAGDAKLLGQAKVIISQALSALHSRTQPYLSAGRTAFDEQDYPRARDEYLAALKVDYKNSEAKSQLAKIRDILHERSKKIYTEAVILEAVSDFEAARAKFKKCLEHAMPDDIYHGRCSRKYKRFEYFDRGIASGSDLETSAAGAGDPEKPKFPAVIELEPAALPEGEAP
ncbi:MAG: FHA domain-containing protein [Bdellovibrionota bacterium]